MLKHAKWTLVWQCMLFVFVVFPFIVSACDSTDTSALCSSSTDSFAKRANAKQVHRQKHKKDAHKKKKAHTSPKRQHADAAKNPTQQTFVSGQSLVDQGPPHKMKMDMKTARTPEQKKVQKTITKGKSTAFNGTQPADTSQNGAAKAGPGALAGAASNACDSIAVRRPWSQASIEDRQAFLQAASCLTTKPGKFDKHGKKSRSVHEDFVLLHVVIADIIHGQAYLLPCHRLLLNAWFNALQHQCGYKGDLLYLDIGTYGDANSFFTTEDLWSDTLYGSGSGLIRNGVQKDYRVKFVGNDDESLRIVDRPLQRSTSTINDDGTPYMNYMTSDYIRAVLEIGNYDRFRHQLEYTTHMALHSGIGGDLGPRTSVNDAFFWGIHSCVDMIWNAWQLQNNGANRDKFDGTVKLADGSSRQAKTSDACPMLDMWSIDFNVADLLDVKTKPNCYRYEFPASFELKDVQQ